MFFVSLAWYLGPSANCYTNDKIWMLWHDLLSQFFFAGCRQLSSRITSSNDSNCSSITIITTIQRTTTRTTCMAQSDPSHRPARSLQTQWLFRWRPTTRPCTSRTHSSFRRTASTWTCISRSAVHATCSKAWMAATTTTSSTVPAPTMTRCCSPPVNALRSWTSSRTTTARLRHSSSSRIRSRPCKRHPRAPTLQTPTSRSVPLRPATPINRLSSKTANYWTEWIRSITTPIRPISIISWSLIKTS